MRRPCACCASQPCFVLALPSTRTVTPRGNWKRQFRAPVSLEGEAAEIMKSATNAAPRPQRSELNVGAYTNARRGPGCCCRVSHSGCVYGIRGNVCAPRVGGHNCGHAAAESPPTSPLLGQCADLTAACCAVFVAALRLSSTWLPTESQLPPPCSARSPRTQPTGRCAAPIGSKWPSQPPTL